MPSPPTNIILNDGFEMGQAHWSGTGIEIGRESVYLPGSTNPLNMIAEMDRNGFQTTVLMQSFTIETPLTTNLTFQAALRQHLNAGQEGFLVEIVDSADGVIAAMTVLPPAPVFAT